MCVDIEKKKVTHLVSPKIQEKTFTTKIYKLDTTSPMKNRRIIYAPLANHTRLMYVNMLS